jgi:hypothetical protein
MILVIDTTHPPCTNCTFNSDCKTYYLACRRFAAYCSEARPKSESVPNRVTYMWLFPETDQSRLPEVPEYYNSL